MAPERPMSMDGMELPSSPLKERTGFESASVDAAKQPRSRSVYLSSAAISFASLLMDVLCTWKEVFGRWPSEMPRRGILVVEFGEQIPFSGFLISEAFLLAERQMPDSMGARTVLVPYNQIAAVKILDIVKPKLFHSLGFETPPGQK